MYLLFFNSLSPTGKAGEMIDRGDNTYGGKYVINPSGGLISKGHPLGATGLAQCAELCWQLRGAAGKRQVASAKLALQHNLGLGGAVVVTLYRLGFPQQTSRFMYMSLYCVHIHVLYKLCVHVLVCVSVLTCTICEPVF